MRYLFYGLSFLFVAAFAAVASTLSPPLQSLILHPEPLFTAALAVASIALVAVLLHGLSFSAALRLFYSIAVARLSSFRQRLVFRQDARLLI